MKPSHQCLLIFRGDVIGCHPTVDCDSGCMQTHLCRYHLSLEYSTGCGRGTMWGVWLRAVLLSNSLSFPCESHPSLGNAIQGAQCHCTCAESLSISAMPIRILYRNLLSSLWQSHLRHTLVGRKMWNRLICKIENSTVHAPLTEGSRLVAIKLGLANLHINIMMIGQA